MRRLFQFLVVLVMVVGLVALLSRGLAASGPVWVIAGPDGLYASSDHILEYSGSVTAVLSSFSVGNDIVLPQATAWGKNSFSVSAYGIVVDLLPEFFDQLSLLRSEFSETGDMQVCRRAVSLALSFGAEYVSIAYSRDGRIALALCGNDRSGAQYLMRRFSALLTWLDTLPLQDRVAGHVALSQSMERAAEDLAFDHF